MSSSSPTPELHGCEGEVMFDVDEERVCLERVTVTDRAEAIRLIAERRGFDDHEEVDPQPIHMRRVTDDNDPELEEVVVDDVPCWLECPADHPDAVPFWKDAP